MGVWYGVYSEVGEKKGGWEGGGWKMKVGDWWIYIGRKYKDVKNTNTNEN